MVQIQIGEAIKPKNCSICDDDGGGRIVGHHPDYDKPLEVVWVCSSCHRKIHSGGIVVGTKRSALVVNNDLHYKMKNHCVRMDITLTAFASYCISKELERLKKLKEKKA